jgi:hypothetical protein
MGDDSLDLPQSERRQSLWKTILQAGELPRCPAAPLPRYNCPCSSNRAAFHTCPPVSRASRPSR